MQEHYITNSIRIDFSKKEASSQLNGIYVTAGVRGMLEGKDFHNLDAYFPFIFGYVDCWLGYEHEAPLTKVHTAYTDIVNTLLSDNLGVGWTDMDLENMQSRIQSFKAMVSDLFSSEFPRVLLTLKFHLLDHMVCDIERFGSLKALCASPFEHYNLFVKQAYSSTSKRLLTRSIETVCNLEGIIRKRRSKTHVPRASSGMYSTERRFGLVNQRQYVSLSSLRGIATGDQLHTSSTSAPRGKTNTFLNSLQSAFSADVLSSLVDLIEEELKELDICLLPTAVSLNIVQSGYVLGGFVPTSSNCETIDGRTVILHCQNYQPVRQRVFGISWNRPYMRKKQSFVLLRASSDYEKDELWVAKVLLLFSMKDSSRGDPHEYAFVRYMIATDQVTAVDKELKCVCLRWETDEDVDRTLNITEEMEENYIEVGEWFGLVPFSSVVGTVQVLRSNVPVRPFTSPLPWPLHRFYINRFILPKEDPVDDESATGGLSCTPSNDTGSEK
jgi:hypothetical protein